MPAFTTLHIHTCRAVTDKVHNSISHLNSNYAIYLKDPVHISQILFGIRLLLAIVSLGATDNRIWRRPLLAEIFKKVLLQVL